VSSDECNFEIGMDRLQERLGYRFQDQELMVQALTHRSYANEQTPRIADNERLEFLGDAVLELVISARLFHTYTDMTEGQMTRARAHLVQAESLAQLSRELDIGQLLRLGKGEESTGGRTKNSVLADALEAVFGALYVDGGLALCDTIAGQLFTHQISQETSLTQQDPKSRLQELLQEQGRPTPCYPVVEEDGPDHDRRFLVEVRCEDEYLGQGEGRSKKEAAVTAAQDALSRWPE
jgi:ribonuclease III